MNQPGEATKNTRLVTLLAAGLALGQAAQYLHIESLVYAAVVLAGGLYIAWRPTEALWAGFCLIVVTSQIYPIDVDEWGTSLQGAHRPYIVLVIVVGVSIFANRSYRWGWLWSGVSSRCRNVRGSTLAFVAVLFLASLRGYFGLVNSPGFVDALRECSGWLTLVAFLMAGYRMAVGSNQLADAFGKLRSCAVVYAWYFVVRCMYITFVSASWIDLQGFGNSQRDAVFFLGLTVVFVVAQVSDSNVQSTWREWGPAVLILSLAIVLSGARSVLACAIAGAGVFVLWHSSARRRFLILGAGGLLLVLLGSAFSLVSRDDPKEGALGYVATRFLAISSEDTSYLARASEMAAVLETVRASPMLGGGPFATYSFLDPVFGWKDTTFVDSGIGYLLMKTGLLGTGCFLWFVVAWLRMAKRVRGAFPVSAIPLVASFAFYLVFLPFGPSFFEFQHSWFVGLIAGQAIQIASRLPETRLASVSALCQPGVAV